LEKGVPSTSGMDQKQEDQAGRGKDL